MAPSALGSWWVKPIALENNIMDDLSCKLDKSSSRVRLEIDIAQIGEHGVGGSALPFANVTSC